MEADRDNHDGSNGGERNDFLNLWPVASEESGEGLPYAPENWPNPGDVWGWRTGRRVAVTGHFLDRYLYLPARLCRVMTGSSSKQKHRFASKLSVERYIKEAFPDADLHAFFASFSWKVRALPSASTNERLAAVPLQQTALVEQSESDFPSDFIGCKAGNKMCDSLILEVEQNSPAMPCDICCTEPGFCRDCCCILCCKTVNSAYGGYSYIKCQVKIGYNICGHVAHLECALQSHMAGTVGGSFGLDAEYHCRRCDGRTDLISHVNKLLQTCESIDLEDDIEKNILNLGTCLLCGSEKVIARELLSRIELATSKLKCEINVEDIWKVDDNLTAHPAGFSDNGNAAVVVRVKEGHLDVGIGTKSSGYLPESLKLEAEIDQVLQALRKSQESEYNMAEERFHAHKNYLQSLYQQLDSEKSELACKPHSFHSDVLFHSVAERKEQIKKEVMKFEDMKKVANGFGSTSKDILKENFGLEIAD